MGDFTIRLVRRALLALGVSSVVSAIVRLGKGTDVPRRRGDWRELRGPDLR